jgi:Retroviral aspartyl protease.
MPGTFLYSRIVTPPSPICSVTLSYDDRSGDYGAILDSGADFTCVPAGIVRALALRKITDIDVGGSTNKNFQKRGVYRVNLEFLGFVIAHHRIVSIEGAGVGDYILIGRDILNRYRLLLDGPALSFTIQ